MTKQDILNTTGLSEEEFYQRYPDQETFCSEYPEMCPDMMEDDEEEDINNYQNLGYDEDEISMAAYGGSLYEAQDGVQQPAPYTDYNQYQKAMQNYGTEASKAGTYNNFQNDLYTQSGTSRGSRETTSQLGDMFNTLSPEQQDALAQKYGAQFMPSSTPSGNRKNYVNSMEMNVPGKGTGYYSFPTNDVVYGNKQLERPKYDFPAMTAPQYKMSDTPPAKIQGKPINYKLGTANINFGNTTPTQIINNIGAGYKDPASLNASNGNLPIPKYSLNRTMERVGATNKPYVTPTPNYTSIVDLLKARKQDSSFTNRKKLAEEAGIKNYTGSASQNMDFISRINGIKSSGTEMELGGVNIHPAMRTNFKQGGYYGMDGKLHRAKGSGTYVMNGGYYFQPGGTSTAPPVANPDTAPGAMGDPADVSQATPYYGLNLDNSFNINTDETYNFEDTPEDSTGDFGSDGMGNTRQQRRNARRNAPYETPDLGGLYDFPMDEQQPMIEPYDSSQYSTSINPATGFTNYSKGNRALTNIKKQDPALWGQLKEEGNGARWRTGQTDFQKFGRGVDKVANAGQSLINTAGAFGQFLNSRQELKNANSAIINQNSTASQNTNPQAAGKGTGPGQTGSSYGMMDPTSMGARSFKGMYGKYGMQVPKFEPGGGFSNLFPSAQSVVPINSPISLIPNMSFAQADVPVVDNTAVYQNNSVDEPVDNAPVNNKPSNMPTGTLDPDFALQSMAAIESGSKPGQTKAGLRTKLVGEGGKRASASGTYQITTPTLQDIYNNDKSISSKYDSFNKFKSAFDVDAKVEYQAARSLMARHIKKYGIYALGAWYYPEFARKAAAGDKSVFDIVPRRDFGNRVKWGDDINKKLKAYNKLAGTDFTLNTTFNAPKTVGTSAVTPTAKPAVNNYTPSNTKFSLKGLIDFAKANKFDVTSTTGGHHNPGSKHGKKRAIDVRTKNKTPQQILEFMNIARKAGYRVLDERVRPKGQKVWKGQHLHLDFKQGGQFGGQVMEMDEDEIKQFLKAGGQLEFLD